MCIRDRDALKENGFKPTYVAGHSLGEITALYCADVFSFEDCVSLIKERSRGLGDVYKRQALYCADVFSFEDCVSLIKVRSQLMVNAGQGSMAAVIGFDRNELNLLVKKSKDVVIANDNSSSQVVLSGSNEELDNLSKEISCKRFLKLNVSGAVSYTHLTLPTILLV